MLVAKFNCAEVNVDPTTGELIVTATYNNTCVAFTFEETSELLALVDRQRVDFRNRERKKLPWYKRIFTL